MTQFPETSASLLVQIRSPENRVAWDAFAATYQPVIYRMARRYGMQDANAQDLVQDVLVRVSSAIGKYEQQPGIRFRNWLGRVARNAILTALTRLPLDVGEGGTVANDELKKLSESTDAMRQELDEEVEREQFLRAASIVRTDVNNKTWLAFELTAINGLTCEAAAAELGTSVGTVYAGRSRIFKRLRDQISLTVGETS